VKALLGTAAKIPLEPNWKLRSLHAFLSASKYTKWKEQINKGINYLLYNPLIYYIIHHFAIFFERII